MMAQILREDDLRKIAEEFVMRFNAQARPEWQAILEKKQPELIHTVTQLLTQQKSLTRESFSDSVYTQKLTATLAMAVYAHLSIEAKMRAPDFRVQSAAALVELEGFLQQLQKANPKLIAALQANPGKFMELLSPEAAKKLQSLMAKVSASALSLSLKPTPGSKKKDDMLNALSELSQSAKPDPYNNLLGLMLSSQTGALPVVIYCYLGNGLGIVDYNPNNGWAPIDSINEINLQFGDSLGLEKKTIDNFMAIPDTIIDTFGVVIEELSEGWADKAQAMHRAQLLRPTPFSKQGGPQHENEDGN